MSYNKLESPDVPKTVKSKPSKAANTSSMQAQLKERQNVMKEKESNNKQTIQTQTDSDYALALKLSNSEESIDSNVQFVNNLNNANNEVQHSRSSKSKWCNCLCQLWQRNDYTTLIISPIMLSLLLFILLSVNQELLLVWVLSALTFYIALIFCYFYTFECGTESVLDTFTLSMIYGAFIGMIAWVFVWLLAATNDLLLGPFIFMHSGFTLNSTANTIMFGIVASLMYGGIFPFLLVWLKSDKRLCDQCLCKQCKIVNFHILTEYEQLQRSLNLPREQMQQFMAANEREIMCRLELAQKRVRMECVCSVMGYFGTIYILSFMLKFDALDRTDSTLIFVYGYLLKDFIFGILFAVIASYIIARRKLYQIRMNSKFMYYGLLILFGALQQSVSTVLCGLYSHVSVRIYIVYISIAFNAIICVIAAFEIYQQRKLIAVQLDALFVYNSINNLQISESSVPVRMDDLSVVSQQ